MRNRQTISKCAKFVGKVLALTGIRNTWPTTTGKLTKSYPAPIVRVRRLLPPPRWHAISRLTYVLFNASCAGLPLTPREGFRGTYFSITLPRRISLFNVTSLTAKRGLPPPATLQNTKTFTPTQGHSNANCALQTSTQKEICMPIFDKVTKELKERNRR